MSDRIKEETITWKNIPAPVLTKIVKQINLKDVISCSEVCFNWNIVCEDHLLWKYLIKRDFKSQKDKRGFIYLALTYCNEFVQSDQSFQETCN